MNDHGFATIDVTGGFHAVWYKSCFFTQKRQALFIARDQVQNDLECSKEKRMRSLLINKNISFYYWLKKRIGKQMALEVAKVIERAILILGRERMPYRRVKMRNRIKRLELICSIKKSILICKVMNYAHFIK